MTRLFVISRHSPSQPSSASTFPSFHKFSGRGKFLNPVDRIEPLARAALVLMGWIFKVWVGWLIYGNIPHSSKYKNVIFMNNTSQGLLVTVNLVNME